jgi:2-oxoacid:acceptor oxidoreductase delta subunit (pyruvate/2-ketoisovalerate family)
MPAHDFEVEEALQEGVMVKWLSTIKQAEIDGNGGALTIEKMVLDEQGRAQPTGEFETLEADSLVLALGQDVDLSLLDGVHGLALKDGVVQVDPATMMTGHPGLFAGGDMVPAERNVTVAVGHGKKAARHIDAWLMGPRSLPCRPHQAGGLVLRQAQAVLRTPCAQPQPPEGAQVAVGRPGGDLTPPSSLRSLPPEGDQVALGRPGGDLAAAPSAKHPLATFERLNPWYYSDAPQTLRPQLDLARRTSSFDEVQGGLTETNALFEARRCLSCGNCFECDNCYGVCPDNAVIKLGPGKRFEINLDYCKGCGICAAECPCGAIDMVAEEA